MNISDQAIEFLVSYITGDGGETPYRSGPKLVDFFNCFGADDLYGQGFPSRHQYTREKLQQFNSSDKMKSIIQSAFYWEAESERTLEDHAYRFSKLIAVSGYKLKKDYQPGFVHEGAYVPGPIFFEVVPAEGRPLEVPGFALRSDNLRAYIEKANSRIELSDFSGAISICHTLVEEFLKLSLSEVGADFRESEGDIKKTLQELL